MEGGCSSPLADGIAEHLSSLSLEGDEEQKNTKKSEKDPRTIARKYQLDLCMKAVKENVIIYLGTGCGKTHIAVLLIYEMGHLIKKPQKNVCIFLAPTVALVQQQAKVIGKSIDFKVGTYCGSSMNLRSRCNWEKELEEHEVLVMTPRILLHNLSHCFIKIELIALLIFDECHYAQVESNHPYAEIMKIFYKVDSVKLPRILGMTASPILGKGGSIDSLEALLRARVYSIQDDDELEQFVTSPEVNVYYYGSTENDYSCTHLMFIRKLEEIKNQSMSTLRMSTPDQNILRNSKKSLQKKHSDLAFCLQNLGLWGALQPLAKTVGFISFQKMFSTKGKSYIASKGDHYEDTEMVEEERSCSDHYLCNKYLQRAASVLASDCAGDGMQADISRVDVLKEPFFSKKLLRLIGILSNFRLQTNMKCIIFVNRIVIARSLTYILQNLKFLCSWKCDFLVGIHSGLVSRKNTAIILEKFRSGELNLLVATKVGEEGLDIQTCCLVIRFDLPETVASFIQSRGRARMPQSEYAFLVDRGNPRELDLIEHFKKDEDRMNEEISSRKSHVTPTDFEERTYKVDITGATISSVSSIALLHHYCSKLPHDEYFNPKPQFFYYDDVDGVVCNIILPANAPIHQIVSAPQLSNELSKRDACLKACKELHEVGALTDYLLPDQDDKYDEATQDLSDSDSCDDENLRAELHEMLVPAALRGPWNKVGDSTYFSSYYVKFSPNPVDRIYRKFGLFVKESLPQEAGNMQLDLCLARGRMVTTKFIPSGVATFNEDEVASAEKFQQMFLSIILDRSKFIPEYFSLEENDVHEANTSTFYLMLPIVLHDDDKISVDWMLVNRCLSSPIFRHRDNVVDDEIPQPGSHLHLSNGGKDVHDIVDSLVYVPCKDTFFFISGICREKNGYSLYDESKTHAEHYIEVFDIHLAHLDQPLLKAKQLFILNNLLRKKKHSEEWREKEEHFIELPPEICQLKIIGFSKDIGSSLSLLPSIMRRLESFLVAIELREKLFASFPEAAEVTADRILEALTTEKCCEHFSLERLEVLGDAFLKFAVGRHLFLEHDALDEGQLTRKRSNIVNNNNLHKLAIRNNLQVYIRDQSLEPSQFFTFGHPCPITCKKETEKNIHFRCSDKINGENAEVRCNRGHHWLYKKVIADVVEALIGAFIVDSGFKAATAFLNWLGIQVDFSPSQIHNICSASAAFLPLADQIDVNALENLLGYKFYQKGLLIQAFVHPSFNNHSGGCYQRLEFLGDAVLDYLITSYLYSVYPNLKPGQLTDLRSASVNNISFAGVAGRWSFHKFILCDSSPLLESMTEYLNSIRTSTSAKGHIEELTCPKVLGDVVESCVGALFLDTGFDLNRVWKIVLSLLDPVVTLSNLQLNPLRDLRELCQFHNWELQFSSVRKDGKFLVEAKVDEKTITATACATNVSGKIAKKIAARQVFECLKARGYRSKSKSLDEVLRKCEKREAKLIGYDVKSSIESVKFGKLKIQESPRSDREAKLYPLSEASTTKYDIVSRPLRHTSYRHTASELHVTQTIHNNGFNVESPARHLNIDSGFDPQGTGSICNGMAKSCLYEMCAANCWKPPIFECCNETGPSHSKQFIYKIVLDIEEMPEDTFEFYGEPRARKKDAAENAAQGAVWFLKCQGYIWDQKLNKGTKQTN